MIRLPCLTLALLAAAALYTYCSAGLPLAGQWSLLAGAAPDTYDDVVYMHAVAPRAAMAILVGAALGVAGSLLQQVTQNVLVSPLTIGASSGAWLALVAGTIAAPVFAASYASLLTMAGAVAATAVTLAVAGRGGLAGLPVVLAGMAVNLLLGAIATVLVLLNDRSVQSLFIWGAGDLAQTGWSDAIWLAPQFMAALALAAICHRPLTLMRVGVEGAGGRGLRVWPFVVLVVLAALWMTASAIAVVGVIGFIGLVAPNLARLAGARQTLDVLISSAILGALVLLATDGAALYASTWTRDLVPSGASAALIGLPALVWLSLRQLRARDYAALRLPEGPDRVSKRAAVALLLVLPVFAVASLGIAPSVDGWRIAWPSGTILDLRWPRVVTAAAAGAGMALSGAILQRLLRNPLASPDIVGISSGATLALVASATIFGGSIHDFGAPAALLGGLAVLGVLLALARRHDNAPAAIALIGISLAALSEALLQFVLAKGGEDSYMIVGWLAGSTARASASDALLLASGVAVLVLLTTGLHRWLTLLGAGDDVAFSRGLSVARAKGGLLVLAAALAAGVTAITGPIAFVGLIAPHAAILLGARRALDQIALAVALGVGLMILSDWAGRTLLYPAQLPAGAMASILGGVYFVVVLARRRA